MHSDPKLVARLEQLLAGRRAFTPRKMFGGMAYLLNGNMCVGVYHQSLIARVGEPAAVRALKRLHVSPMDITGKPMKGWVIVAAEGVRRRADLKRYLDAAAAFVGTIPNKAK